MYTHTVNQHSKELESGFTIKSNLSDMTIRACAEIHVSSTEYYA